MNTTSWSLHKTIEATADQSGVLSIKREDGSSVLAYTYSLNSTTEAEMRIMSSAPKLLAALEESVNQLATLLGDPRRYGFSNERINQTSAALFSARAAIAKATKGTA